MSSTLPRHAGPYAARSSCAIRAALLMLLVASMPLYAASVVAVLSSDADPYQKSLAELTKNLTVDGHAVRPIMLEQLTPADLSRADCIVTIGSAAATAVHKRNDLTSPLVYCMVGDVSASDLDQATPACGVEAKVPFAIQFTLIAEALPQVRRVGLLHANDEAGKTLSAAVRSALPSTWELKEVVTNGDRIGEQLSAVTTDVDLVLTSPDGALYTEATVRALLLNAMRRRVPVFGFSISFVRAGALLGVGIDPGTQGAQAAELAKQSLALRAAGKAPLASQVPSIYQIAVNLVVAEKLDVEIPATLVERATHVFKAGR